MKCPKDIGKINQINMPRFKAEYFLRTKNSSGKGVRYEKTKKWVKLEVGEGLIIDLCKYMTYRYPQFATGCKARYETKIIVPLMVRTI